MSESKRQLELRRSLRGPAAASVDVTGWEEGRVRRMLVDLILRNHPHYFVHDTAKDAALSPLPEPPK